MESIRGILRAVSEPANGEASPLRCSSSALARSTRSSTASGVSHALPAGQLVPGADVVVHLADRHHPGDAQIVAIAGVTSSGGSGPDMRLQSGTVPVGTDRSGNGGAGRHVRDSRSQPRRAVSVGAVRSVLQPGTIRATAVTNTGFTISITNAGTHSGTVMASWSAEGSVRSCQLSVFSCQFRRPRGGSGESGIVVDEGEI